MNPVIAGAALAIAGTAHPRPAWLPSAKARRLDTLATVVCAAVDRLGGTWNRDAGIVVGSAWGCVDSTLRFADDVRAHGDSGGGPAAFTTGVHHHPAGSLGELLGIHGAASTICLDGCSGLAALRWARMMVVSQRLPEVLVVAVDVANEWTRRTVTALTGCPHRLGGGAIALRVSGAGPGRAFDFGARGLYPLGQGPRCDAGGADRAAEARLAANVSPRRSATAIHGAWWPTAALTAAPWDEPTAFDVCEEAGAYRMSAWFAAPSAR